jgi:hypothetical protein
MSLERDRARERAKRRLRARQEKRRTAAKGFGAYREALAREGDELELEAARAAAELEVAAARIDRAQGLGQVRERCEVARKKLTGVCAKRRERVRGEVRERIGRTLQKSKAARRQVKQSLAELAAHEKRRKGTASKRVAESEIEDATRGNVEAVDPTLVPVWETMRAQFRGDGNEAERTERFLEWAEEHQDRVNAIRFAEKDDRDYAADYEAWAREQVA